MRINIAINSSYKNNATIANKIIPTTAFNNTPPILTCPDSRSNLGKKLNKKRLNSGSDIIKHNTNTNPGYLIFFKILSFKDAPDKFIPNCDNKPLFDCCC